MTQPILNSNATISIDHKAGSSPVLNQIPEHTQDELAQLSAERWSGMCLPTEKSLNNFGYHMTLALSSLNELTSEDRIACMKLADGFLTVAENKRDATADEGQSVKKQLQNHMRNSDGGDIDVNKQMEFEEKIARLRQQWCVLKESVTVLETVRERMITELGLQNWPKRYNRKETQRSRKSITRISVDSPEFQAIVKECRTSRKTKKSIVYKPKYNGIDNKASEVEYIVPCDTEIK